MNLKVRLAFLYSLSVFIILLVSGVSIYVLNENFRSAEFKKRLSLEAEESYLLFTSVPQLTNEITEELNQNAINSLPDEELVLFDVNRVPIYQSGNYTIPQFDPEYFTTARKNGSVSFDAGERQAVIIFRRLKGRPVFALATANDIFGRRKMDNLKIVLIFSIVGGLLFSGLIAFFYVKQAMRPLEKLKEKIEKINELNLAARISVKKNNDELTQIARKFNAMLDRLQQAFEQRKSFVHHASHELRTPLANMLSQTEAALSNAHTEAEYKKILHSLKEEQQNLIDLTNSLLTLSRYERIDPAIHWPRLRIDEVLYHTVEFINVIFPKATVAIDFENIPEDEEDLIFEGNESLIRSAVVNLVKNAIQYSANQKATISIHTGEKGITLHFQNTGKQLSTREQENLFIPFFRGENSQNKKGYGLGLSIVQRIIRVHKGTINYQALAPDINRFTLFLPTV